MAATHLTRLDIAVLAAGVLMIGLIIKSGLISQHQHEVAYYAGVARAERDTLSHLPLSSRAAGETIARQTNRNCEHRGEWKPTGEHEHNRLWATSASKAQVQDKGYKRWLACYDDQLSMLSVGADRNTLNSLLAARGLARSH